MRGMTGLPSTVPGSDPPGEGPWASTSPVLANFCSLEKSPEALSTLIKFHRFEFLRFSVLTAVLACDDRRECPENHPIEGKTPSIDRTERSVVSVGNEAQQPPTKPCILHLAQRRSVVPMGSEAAEPPVKPCVLHLSILPSSSSIEVILVDSQTARRARLLN